MTSDKKKLRHHYLAARQTIDRDALSHSIRQNFIVWLGQQSFQNVGSYQAIKKFHEFDLSIIEDLLKNNGSQLFFPQVQGEVMHYYKEETSSEWTISSWGIREIANGEMIQPEALDLIICPLLISDSRGYRVGYGKGFYDKYLSRVRGDCIKIGLGYFEPIEIISDIDHNDVPLDVYISPRNIFEYK